MDGWDDGVREGWVLRSGFGGFSVQVCWGLLAREQLQKDSIGKEAGLVHRMYAVFMYTREVQIVG